MRPRLSRLLIPRRCLACGAPARTELCQLCTKMLVLFPSECCERCALPLPCGVCDGDRNGCDTVVSIAPYSGVARQLVLELKRTGSHDIAMLMATLAASRLNDLGQLSVVPIPPHGSRFKQRGFDHAELLAKAICKQYGGHYRSILKRSTNSTRNVGKPRSDRLTNPQQIVCTANPKEAVLLVDDVYTTGATLAACAQALKKAGAKRIEAVTFARTLK